MRKLSNEIHQKLVNLRKLGKSIPEISKETGVAKTTVLRHIGTVKIPPQFQKRLKEKQGGSKERAYALRENIRIDSANLIGSMSKRDYLFLLIGLYWGEGTKADFSVINSDPSLIQTFILCLQTLQIPKERLSLSLRLHKGIPVKDAKTFWAQITGLPKSTMGRVEIIEGKKKGKLPYGMCRVRIKSGIRDRLLIQSSISLIGRESSKQVVSR